MYTCAYVYMCEYAYIYIHHISLIYSSVSGHLGFFHVLAVVNSAARIYCIAQGTHQYYVKTYMGKESEIEWIYVYV